MRRLLLILGLTAAMVSAIPAYAEVVDGSASPAPKFLARGATEVASAGPLAPSLQGKPVVVRIHADWCIACKATEATIGRLKQAYAGRIFFVEFDVTNAQTAAAARQQAESLGLAKFYDASKQATSMVAVIEPRDGKVLAAFYNDNNLGDYTGAVDTALAAVSHS